MENEIENSISSISNNYVVDEGQVLAYDYYDYRELIQQQNVIISNQNKTYDLLNQGFTFISFLFIILYIYIYFKNMIRK